MSEQDKNTTLNKDEQAEYLRLKNQFKEQFKKTRENLTPLEDYIFLKQEEVIAKNREKACHDGAESAQKYLENTKYRLGLESPSEFTINRVREIGCAIGETLSAAGVRNEKAPEEIGEAVQKHLDENKMGTHRDAQNTLNEAFHNAPTTFDELKCKYNDLLISLGVGTPNCGHLPSPPSVISPQQKEGVPKR